MKVAYSLISYAMNTKFIEWILRISVAGEFVGHGIFALGFFPSSAVGKSLYFIPQKAQWVGWIRDLLGVSPETAVSLLTLVGGLDLITALVILLYPVRIALLWAAIWGFWTALLRPLVGEPVWDFVERWANWGAPLALLFMAGWPRDTRGWFNKVQDRI